MSIRKDFVSGSTSPRKEFSEQEVIDVLRRTYYDVYEIPEEDIDRLKFTPETRIFRDLRANNPDTAYALQWRTMAARELGIPENKLPRPKEGKDYTIRELVDMTKGALGKK